MAKRNTTTLDEIIAQEERNLLLPENERRIAWTMYLEADNKRAARTLFTQALTETFGRHTAEPYCVSYHPANEEGCGGSAGWHAYLTKDELDRLFVVAERIFLDAGWDGVPVDSYDR